MKIAIVIDSLSAGGAERMLLRQIKHSNWDPIVYTLGGPKDLEDKFREVGAKIVDVGSLEQGYLKPITTLIAHLRTEEPDIVHAHLPTSHIVARIAAKIAGVDKVVSTHHNIKGSITYSSLAGSIEKITRPLDNMEVAVSKTVRDSHQSSLLRQDWKIIYNAIDVGSFRSNVLNSESINFDQYSPIFLNVGRYVEQKAQADLVKAMPIVLEEFPNAAAIIVGWGKLQSRLDDLTKELGVSDSVFVTGKVPSVYEYYETADVFVLPSRWEGLPIVLLEAMASGLPVIASNISSMTEVIDDDFGRLVQPGVPNELADIMISVAKSDLNRMGQKGLAKAKDDFDIENLVKSYNELYSKL